MFYAGALANRSLLKTYAATALAIKRPKPSDRDVILYARNIFRSFARIYRAVALDIDGTLTRSKSAELNVDLIPVVINLLEKGVPVLLVTGRGQRTALQAARVLRSSSSLSTWYFRRLRCACYEGAKYYYTKSDKPDEFLEYSRSTIASQPNTTALLHSLEERIGDSGSGHIQSQALIPRASDEKLGLRVVTTSQSDRDAVVAIIHDAIKALGIARPGDTQLNVSAGAWEDKYSISVTVGNKLFALREFAESIGTDESKILRIGDQGCAGGNDFELLDHLSGFSVDAVNESISGCHPILDEAGICQLKGSDATKVLLDRVNIFPPLSIDIRNSETLRSSFRAFESIAVARARSETKYVSQKLRYRLKGIVPGQSTGTFWESVEISDVFDTQSGAVLFREWELEKYANEASIEDIFEFSKLSLISEKKPGPRLCMYTDSAIIARGPDYYYALTRTQDRLEIEEFLRTCLVLFKRVKVFVESLGGRAIDFTLFKILLGCCDNVRNYLLIVQNILFQHSVRENASEDDEREVMRFFSDCLVLFTKVHYDLLFNEHERLWNVKENIGAAILVAEIFVERYIRHPSIVAMSGQECLRKWRETDFFIQNATAIALGIDELCEYGRDPETGRQPPWCAVGLMYGGLELVALAVVIGRQRHLDIGAGLIKVSTYHAQKTASSIRAGEREYLRELLRRRALLLCDGEGKPISYDDKRVCAWKTILVDDNFTTGITLQMARDLLAIKGANVTGAIVVRFAGSNRHAHMAVRGRGFPDPDMMFSFVRGLIAPSPYSRLLYPRPDPREEYLDQTLVFDKSRKRIERYLEKNNTPPAEHG